MSAECADLDRHRIEIELVEAVPEEIDAGSALTLAIRITSSSELDLGGAPFLIAAADDVRSSGEMPGFTGGKNDSVRITFAVPAAIGKFDWNLVIPEHERDGVVREAASLPFSFRTRPHITSLAVWDYPSPVVIGEKFKLKVGAQCSAACASLQGQDVEIRDATGAVLASVPLSATPWPETHALYWAEVDLMAPGAVGLHAWTVRFSPARVHLPHGGASFTFSLIADRPPEHTVMVKLVEERTQAPIDNALVRLGACRTSTDEAGLARLAVPGGTHELSIWRRAMKRPREPSQSTAMPAFKSRRRCFRW
jgi:hypothetical protein